MLLNEEYQFSDVRYLITANPAYKRGYDAGKAFIGFPEKVKLNPATVLVRLDFAVPSGLFSSPWWMEHDDMRRLMNESGPAAADLRQDWQQHAALRKPSKGVRTFVIEISLIEPVYAWAGIASGLFGKGGGANQVYLPNLGRGHGPNKSDYAQLLHTYILPAS